MYGIVCAFLGVPVDQAVTTFLFSSLRTTVAAAVRLGAVGTLEGQRMQFILQSRIPEIIERQVMELLLRHINNQLKLLYSADDKCH